MEDPIYRQADIVASRFVSRLPQHLRAQTHDDARQEALLAALQVQSRIDATISTGRHFTERRMIGALLDFARRETGGRRRHLKFPLEPLPLHLPDESMYLDRSIKSSEVRSWIRFLSGNEARVFEGLLADLEYHEIAASIGLSISRVGQLKNSLVKKLQRRLGACMQDDHEIDRFMDEGCPHDVAAHNAALTLHESLATPLNPQRCQSGSLGSE
jgi:RNA polymerase sigma factor (sigma-70 family)